jgi:hypothetical protein
MNEHLEVERLAKLEAQVETIKENVSEMKDNIKELHSRITTSNREIVDKIDDMQTRIEHKMNANAAVSNQQHEKITIAVGEDMDKIRNRVQSLEQWKWYVIGGAVAIGYLVGHISTFVNLLK